MSSRSNRLVHNVELFSNSAIMCIMLAFKPADSGRCVVKILRSVVDVLMIWCHFLHFLIRSPLVIHFVYTSVTFQTLALIVVFIDNLTRFRRHSGINNCLVLCQCI